MPLHLFDGYGIELEYMIVNKNNLYVSPVADKVIHEVCGKYLNEIEFGLIAWSNELVLHVIELKTNGPNKNISILNDHFHNNVKKINEILERYDAFLMPTGAHPLMNPKTQTKLWPHENKIIYETFDRIFDVKRHGWANLQSSQLNLPFANDAEFAKLHAAIRLILPIIPAIAASTPILEGKAAGILDSRLEAYRKNQEKIPSITGMIIPEKVYSKSAYQDKILTKIYSDLSPYDKQQILRHEWVNSRGATARFERNAIEIRIIDSQECPKADLAVLSIIAETLKLIISEKWSGLNEQMVWPENRLFKILLNVIRSADEAIIDDKLYLSEFGFKGAKCRAIELWQHIIVQLDLDMEWSAPVKIILDNGPLARRILNSLKNSQSKDSIIKVYRKLAECLRKNELFEEGRL